MLSKEMWKEISGSKSQNLGINHNKTNSRNIDLANKTQSWLGKSANLPTTHQKQCFMDFGLAVVPVDSVAHRPCCKGRKSYIASNHTSLNMSRRASRRNSKH